ncbi:MAG: hypothetical protein WBI07_19970 [Mobilitalea sp.]
MKILKKRINKVHIDISQNLSGEFKLKAESKVQVKTPKEEEEKTALILIETSISIPDSDDINIILNAEYVSKFDGVPSDYNTFIEEKCIPLAQEALFKSLDNIIIEMGYEKLGLAEK